MDLIQKLKNLRRLSNLALYRWTAGRQRIAGAFIPLTALRFNSIVCDGGRVSYSSAAPVLYVDHGRPTVRLMDHGVVCPVSGPRKGTNLPVEFVRDGEDATEARYVTRTDMDEAVTGWRRDRVMSMGCSPCVPIFGIVKPRFYRLTRHPETLKPMYSSHALAVLGLRRGVTMDELRAAFVANLDLFGMQTEDGFVVPHEYIATGGCLVAAADGISRNGGSLVHEMPLNMFTTEVENQRWKIQEQEQK